VWIEGVTGVNETDKVTMVWSCDKRGRGWSTEVVEEMKVPGERSLEDEGKHGRDTMR